MATVRARIVILTVRITLSVCPFNRMAHTADSHQFHVRSSRFESPVSPCAGAWYD
jgi:hypothetical protein